VVAANALSTIVMLAYPPLAILIGFDQTHTGIFLGATIHDMAQVVGAGYAISDPVGNVAVAISWGDYFTTLTRGIGVSLPVWLTTGHPTEPPSPKSQGQLPALSNPDQNTKARAVKRGPQNH